MPQMQINGKTFEIDTTQAIAKTIEDRHVELLESAKGKIAERTQQLSERRAEVTKDKETATSGERLAYLDKKLEDGENFKAQQTAESVVYVTSQFVASLVYKLGKDKGELIEQMASEFTRSVLNEISDDKLKANTEGKILEAAKNRIKESAPAETTGPTNVSTEGTQSATLSAAKLLTQQAIKARS